MRKNYIKDPFVLGKEKKENFTFTSTSKNLRT